MVRKDALHTCQLSSIAYCVKIARCPGTGAWLAQAQPRLSLRSGPGEQLLLVFSVGESISWSVPGAGVGPSTAWMQGPVPSELTGLYVLQLVSSFYKIPIT